MSEVTELRRIRNVACSRDCAIAQLFPIGLHLMYKGIKAEVMSHSSAHLDGYSGLRIEYVTKTGEIAKHFLSYPQLNRLSDGRVDQLAKE